MEVLIAGEKIDLPPGSGVVILTPADADSFDVMTMLAVGDSEDELAVYTMGMLARGLAYLVANYTDDVMDAARAAQVEDDQDYPAAILLAGGLTLEDMEPDGNC